MKSLKAAIILILFFTACARFPEEQVRIAKLEIEAIYYSDLPSYMPSEWTQMKDVWHKLDEAERNKDRDAALRWYYYAMQKTTVFEELLHKKKEEEEKLKKIREENEKRKRDEEKTKIQIPVKKQESTAVISSAATVKKEKTMDDIRLRLERRYPSFYTVRDGEILEKIAEMPYIYSDKYQWPLIYKYNRNQIGDPKKLYKGQILKIPRNVTVDEVYKAREDAGAVNPKSLPKNAFLPEKYKKLIDELLAED